MWKIKALFSRRLSAIGIPIAFIVPGFGLLFSGGGFVGIILGWVFIAIGLVVFFVLLAKTSRNEIPPLEHSVKNSKIVWGLWFTGDTVREKGLVEKYNSIKRILLLDPTSEAFKEHIRNSMDAEERAEKQIRHLTRQAREKNIEVRWHQKEQENGITFYDSQQGNEPTSDKAWCVYEIHDLRVPRERRQRFMIRKVNNQEEFNILMTRYKDTWNEAREPKPERHSS